MMPDGIARIVLTVSESLELSLIAKATIILGLALLAVHVARRARASVRHVVLASAFGVLLTLPAVALLLPPIAVSVSDAYADDRPAAPPIGEMRTVRHLADTPDAKNRTTTGMSSDRIATLLRYGWSAVAMLFLVPVAAVIWRLRRLRRCGLPWLKGEPLVRAIAAQAGIERPVDILLHEDIAAPLTCGFGRPAIVLPPDADEWGEADVRQALVHELEHVRRADWPIQIVARLVCGLYWFHPLVWAAWRQLCLESERACDDAVLQSAKQTEYAEQSVTLAGRLSNGAMRPVLSMASRSDLSARITAVLDSRQRRGRAGALSAGVTIAIAALVVLSISPLRAVTRTRLQAPGGGPSFEVASVKPNKSGEPRVLLHALPGRFTATNAPLRMLIREAYALQSFQLLGGPDWLDSDRFDIAAKAEGNPTPELERLMLRALLAERFKLSVHSETRELPLYAMVMARTDGRLGPQLRHAGTDCAQAAPWSGLGPPDSPRDPNGPCRSVGQGSGGGMRFRGITLDAFAKFLATPARRIVIDRTGLTGDFDIDLEMTAELGPPPPPPGAPDRVDRTSAPSIFTALQEQLGLKLDSRRGAVEVLVIDHVEPPVPN
jgi:bla regulator protein blaR1